MEVVKSIFRVPKKIAYTTGVADQDKPLTAFDMALQAAGIHDTNLIPVSSTIPPDAEQIQWNPKVHRLHPGSSVQVVLCRSESSKPGEKVVTCVSGCRLKHPDLNHPYNQENHFGVNVEYHAAGNPDDQKVDEIFVKKYCKEMLENFAQRRGASIVDSTVTHAFSEHVVRKCGCSISAVVYLDE